jgi:Mor family transcriptional regulator
LVEVKFFLLFFQKRIFNILTKIPIKEFDKIIELRKMGMTIKNIAKIYNVSTSPIHNIINQNIKMFYIREYLNNNS